MTSIGFLSYTKKHPDLFLPQRMRALVAEALLQGVVLELLDGSLCEPKEGWISGAVWSHAGWRTGPIDLPDVVVLRDPPRTAAQQATDAWIRRSGPVIADSPIDKLDLQALLSGGSLAAHAIPTLEIPEAGARDALTSFLVDHGAAVVKAADGQRGIGIHFVVPHGEGWIARKERSSVKGTLEEVVDHLVSRIRGRLRYRRYLVQQYVPSLSPDGRALDIRVHVQRRADRNWSVTRAYTRLAEAGMPLTNISRGGYQGPLEGALEGRGRPVETLRREVLALALAVCAAVDATRPLPLSELGVDLAIDGDGRLRVIEANVFPQSSLHEQDWATHMIGYAKAVAEAAGRPGA